MAWTSWAKGFPMKLRLPRHAHTPGEATEPDLVPLDEAKALIPGRFTAGVPINHPALQFGLRLYENGYFWEAHEILEAIWMVAPQNGRDRLALRALIQLANAALKPETTREFLSVIQKSARRMNRLTGRGVMVFWESRSSFLFLRETLKGLCPRI